VTFVERDRRALDALEQNISACGVEDACAIIRDDFVKGRWAARAGAFDLVLLDPPYEVHDVEALMAAGAAHVTPGGRLVLEHSRRRASPESAGPLRRIRVLTAGDSALSFYT
jgi:16S rRNA G966 N2-methylase RsmD